MNYTEIFELKKKLLDSDIPFEMKNLYDGFQICYPEDGEDRVCSVIQHFGSYGHKEDLLEIMGLLTEEEKKYDDVVGFLTAEEVFERIENHFRRYR